MKIISKIVSKAKVNCEVFNKELLPDESCLITPNHQGMFDPLIIMTSMEKPLGIVMKKELCDVPVLRSVVKMMEFTAIDRSNLRQSMSVIKNITSQLENGRSCIIFPEGTRSKDKNKLLEFKGGSFKAAVNAKAPIVPTCLIDAYKVFDNNSIKKVTVQLHYLQPLYYEDYKDLNTQEIAEIVKQRIEDCIYANENRF